jgi:hypothetical protein
VLAGVLAVTGVVLLGVAGAWAQGFEAGREAGRGGEVVGDPDDDLIPERAGGGVGADFARALRGDARAGIQMGVGGHLGGVVVAVDQGMVYVRFDGDRGGGVWGSRALRCGASCGRATGWRWRSAPTAGRAALG